MPNPRMTQSEREAFLADVHVGVFAVNEAGRGACAVPVWYHYSPGGPVRITASPASRKVRLLRDAGRASLCVQRESRPVQYVSIEGPVEIVETDVAQLQRVIAQRYLGDELADRYFASFGPGLEEEVLLVLHPERWWSVDFGKAAL